MKRTSLLMLTLLMLLCGLCITAQAEDYTEFCTLDAQFVWNESVSARVTPYASSTTNGISIQKGEIVFIKRLVKNSYGNLWAELTKGGFVCFYDAADNKLCATFESFNSGASPVTASGVYAPEGEYALGSSFDYAGVISSANGCPIYTTDIWVTQGSTHQYDEIVDQWFTGVVTKFDIEDLNVSTLYDMAELDPGSYRYMVRVVMGFTYDDRPFAFGDYYYPIQTDFTIIEAPTAYTVPSGSLDTKLAYLKTVFPQGWYWNHWSSSDLGSNYAMRSFTVNGHATTISTKPCDKNSSLHANVSKSTCNHYWGSWGGVQCTGFARMMFELIWDMDTEKESYGMYYHPDTDNADVLDYVKPGDMVWTGGHMFLVTAVSGDNFTVVHCNRNSNCNIEWNYTYTKDWVHARMKGNGTGYVASPTPIVYGSDITNWAKYEVVTTSLSVRKWASTNVDKACTLKKGDCFYVDLNHTITKSGNVYGYCRTADGQYGWVQYANTSYAVPVEACAHTNAEWVVVKMCNCTEEGLEHFTCTECGEVVETYIVPAAGHFESDWVVITEATANADGLKRQSCEICGETLKEEVIPATGSDLLSGITLSSGPNLAAVPGGTVTVPIIISNPDGVPLGSITLYYTLPEGVTVSKVTTCGAAANASVQFSDSSTFAYDINEGISGSGQVLSVTFAVSESASFPLSFNLNPEIVAADLSADATPASIHITIEEGSKRTPGDVNEDGKINSRDALAVIKYAAGQPVSINTANADVNADGKINSRDALAIIKYASGQDVTLK